MMRGVLIAAVVGISMVTSAAAQEQLPDAAAKRAQVETVTPRRDPPQVALKVQVVLTRTQGEKKISSMPFVLGVLSPSAAGSSVRMGVDVPIMAGPKVGGSPANFNYRNVGTNIDCRAENAGDGLYRLVLTVEDSSVQINPPRAGAGAQEPTTSDFPSFRTFKSSFSILLRDGQTHQYTSATDPVSGEVMKVDVGLTVVK